MGDANGVLSRNPAGSVVALLIDVTLGAAAKTHKARFIGLGQLPGPTPFEPFVGDFYLPAVTNELVKNSKFIANAISRGWNLQACQGVHVAGCQPPKATIAKTRLFFHIQNLLQRFDAEVAKRFFCFFLNPQVEQIAIQLGADQEFSGEIGHRFLRFRAHRFGGGQIPHHQAISHGITQGHVQIVTTGGRCEFAEGEEQMFCHAIEHALCVEAHTFRIVVTTRGWQA